MIVYRKSGIHRIVNIFRREGSVFPQVLGPSLFCGFLAGVLKYLSGRFEVPDVIMQDTTMWQGFSSIVGFLVVFRTSMAYNRFWTGCTKLFQMRAEWMDACSNLFAFLKYSTKCDQSEVLRFQHLLARLFSMMHALALAEIEDSSSKMPEDVFAYGFPLIDPNGIDPQTLSAIRHSEAKAELVFQWIQQLIVENMHNPETGKSGVLTIPSPLLSRVFQELSAGMVYFQEALAVSSLPFPFPYAQTCDCLLTVHWVMTPLIVWQWFTTPVWAGLFTFIVVFVLWSLNCIAVEIENPFGPDPNDMDCDMLHEEMNVFILQLMSQEQKTVPHLVYGVEGQDRSSARTSSFVQVWTGALDEEVQVARSVTAAARHSTVSNQASVLRKTSTITSRTSSISCSGGHHISLKRGDSGPLSRQERISVRRGDSVNTVNSTFGDGTSSFGSNIRALSVGSARSLPPAQHMQSLEHMPTLRVAPVLEEEAMQAADTVQLKAMQEAAAREAARESETESASQGPAASASSRGSQPQASQQAFPAAGAHIHRAALPPEAIGGNSCDSLSLAVAAYIGQASAGDPGDTSCPPEAVFSSTVV